MSLAATHANYSKDWWTPPEWMEWVYATLGTRDVFDPCPRDWTPGGFNGLVEPWEAPGYVNHPGTRARGAAVFWWSKYLIEREKSGGHFPLIWCAFSVEQIRHLRNGLMETPGWLVMPRSRVAYIWGGPDDPAKGRVHGQPARSPGNWSVFWSTEYPAEPPVESVIVRTGEVLQASRPYV